MNEFVFPSDARATADQSARPGTTLFALGLWIRLGLSGTCVLIAGLMSLADKQASASFASSMAAAGGLVALIAWQRVRHIFDESDGSASIAQGAVTRP
jgi:hypothetical protein